MVASVTDSLKGINDYNTMGEEEVDDGGGVLLRENDEFNTFSLFQSHFHIPCSAMYRGSVNGGCKRSSYNTGSSSRHFYISSAIENLHRQKGTCRG
ncbi:hypothetical protein SUGI_0649160 [Cryptomeria japonica]|nr:hypothetical protein SUGI_0649160 [Cryptomeria japonica]